jgi:hypothetical protein
LEDAGKDDLQLVGRVVDLHAVQYLQAVGRMLRRRREAEQPLGRDEVDGLQVEVRVRRGEAIGVPT